MTAIPTLGSYLSAEHRGRFLYPVPHRHRLAIFSLYNNSKCFKQKKPSMLSFVLLYSLQGTLYP